MMKSILISIKPQWVAKILNGEKTIEIRRNAPHEFYDRGNPAVNPKPIEVYIYCTKTIKPVSRYDWGEFTFNDLPKLGKIVAKFTLKAVHKFDWRLVANPFFKVRGSCLGYDQLRKYATDKKGIVHDLYGWHISDLEIFDEPKELSEFYSLRLDKDVTELFDNSIQLSNGKWVKRLSNPPQSYCFIEVDE